MSWSDTVTASVVSGVALAVILGILRWLRGRWHVPRVLVRRVYRSRYLSAVLSESERDDVRALDVFAPRLTSAKGNAAVGRIQAAWTDINRRGQTRVLTLDSDNCIAAGAELLQNDVEVRIAPRHDLDSESLSYHVFEAADDDASTVIINRHEGLANHPAKLNGAAPVQIFRRDFEVEWERSARLESVIAERIIGEVGARQDILGSLDRIRTRLKLDSRSVEKIVLHLAFRDSCSVIFIVGQPGAGKSYLRRQLAARLAAAGIETRELTDYVYAYRDLLCAVLKLDTQRGSGFKAYEGGAFIARDEGVLTPALRALALAAGESVRTNEVTLIEFARTDLLAALGEFDEIRQRARVIHISAPEQVRLNRLSRRVIAPQTSIRDNAISVKLSDNHLLPSSAERTLYAGNDSINMLRASSFWGSRVFEIDNGLDGNDSHLQEKVGEFIESIVAGYRPTACVRGVKAA